MNKIIYVVVMSSMPFYIHATGNVQAPEKLEQPVVQMEAQPEEQLSFAVKVSADKKTKKNILLALVGPMDPVFTEIADIIKKDLEFSGALSIEIRSFGMLSSKADVTSLAKEGISIESA